MVGKTFGPHGHMDLLNMMPTNWPLHQWHERPGRHADDLVWRRLLVVSGEIVARAERKGEQRKQRVGILAGICFGEHG